MGQNGAMIRAIRWPLSIRRSLIRILDGRTGSIEMEQTNICPLLLSPQRVKSGGLMKCMRNKISILTSQPASGRLKDLIVTSEKSKRAGKYDTAVSGILIKSRCYVASLISRQSSVELLTLSTCKIHHSRLNRCVRRDPATNTIGSPALYSGRRRWWWRKHLPCGV